MSIFKIPRTSQPQGPVGIDWSNPITRGLVVAVTNKTVSRNALGASPVFVGLTNQAVSKAGLSPLYDGSSSRIGITDSIRAIPVNPAGMTLFCIAKPNQVASEKAVMSVSTFANSFFIINQRTSTQGWAMQLRDSAVATITVQTNVAVVAEKQYSLCAVARSGTGEKSIWVDGVKASVSTASTGNFSPAGVVIGSRAATLATLPFSGLIHIGLAWNRALSDAEIKSLSDNPWQIFQPIAVNPQFELSAKSQIFVPKNYFTQRQSMMLGTSVPSVTSEADVPIVIKKVRTTQPQGPVGIDARSGFTHAIVAGFNVATGRKTISSGRSITLGGVSNIVALSGGQVAALGIPKTASWTILFYGAQIAKNAYPYTIGCTDAANNIALALNHGSYPGRAAFYDGVVIFDSGVTMPVGEEHVVGLTYNRSTGLYAWYKDGVAFNSAVGADVGGTAWQYAAAPAELSTTSQSLLAFAQKALTPAQMLALTDNPWQIFKPDQRIIGVSA